MPSLFKLYYTYDLALLKMFNQYEIKFPLRSILKTEEQNEHYEEMN